MNKHLIRAGLCLLLASTPVLAQDSEEMSEEDSQLMVDPAFSDDPAAVVPAEPSAAERQAAVAASRAISRSRSQEKMTGVTTST